MKIIAVGMNYAAHNKELHHSLELSEPTIFMKSDSSLLKDGKPFFIPDFSSEVHYETEIVVRIDRLGKNIAERFAHRYYNEVTVGIDFTARDLQNKLRAQGLPWEISKAFDNSAVIGTFIPLEQAGDVNRLPFHLDINGSKGQRLSMGPRNPYSSNPHRIICRFRSYPPGSSPISPPITGI